MPHLKKKSYQTAKELLSFVFPGCSGFPTLMLFDHGVPSEYMGPRKADLLIENLKKLVAPDVSVLESDSSIKGFVEAAGVNFPLFIGFGVDESLIAEYGAKYKKKAWFSTAKDFSEDMMVVYDFDKFPALVSVYPKYNEQSVFYGPFEGMCGLRENSFIAYHLCYILCV